MAAQRARRNGGARGRASAPPPITPRGVPKMAYMKLEGASRVAQSFSEFGSPKRLGMMLGGAVMMTGLAAVMAVWIGGSLVDARDAFAGMVDGQAAKAGFEVTDIAVSGVSGVRAEEVRDLALPEGRASMLSADPGDARARIETLTWVEKASVRRLWPSTLRINVTRRQAYALWKKPAAPPVVAKSAPIQPAAKVQWTALTGTPVVIGAAPQAAQPLVAAVERSSVLRSRVQSATLVGERRWDLKLRSGAVLALPAENAQAALDQAVQWQTCCAMLDRPLARIDLRTPGRVVVRPAANRAGA
jgi:cell division protein FtsQ